MTHAAGEVTEAANTVPRHGHRRWCCPGRRNPTSVGMRGSFQAPVDALFASTGAAASTAPALASIAICCAACDRGHAYYTPGCRTAGPPPVVRAANACHQRSPGRRLDHRDRQRACRARYRVTDHTPPPPAIGQTPRPGRPVPASALNAMRGLRPAEPMAAPDAGGSRRAKEEDAARGIEFETFADAGGSRRARRVRKDDPSQRAKIRRRVRGESRPGRPGRLRSPW